MAFLNGLKKIISEEATKWGDGDFTVGDKVSKSTSQVLKLRQQDDGNSGGNIERCEKAEWWTKVADLSTKLVEDRTLPSMADALR